MGTRKIALGLITISSVLVLGACGGANSDTKDASTTKSGMQVKIVDGEYIKSKDLSASSSNKGYLALQLKLTNKSDKSLTFSSNDFTLSTPEDEDIETKNVYDSLDHFQTLDYGKVAKGRSKTGYVVYEVDKEEKKYKLMVNVQSPDSGEEDTIKLPVNATKYDDNSEKITELSKTFINQTFLDGKASVDSSDAEAASTTGGAKVELLGTKKGSNDKKWELANDAEEDKNAYVKAFVEAAKKGWTYYQPGDAEAQKFAEQYIEANSKRAQVEYTVVNYLPTSATVSVKPSVINFKDINTDSLKEDYIRQHENDNNSDYEAVYKDAEKYIFENVHTRYDSAAIATPEYMNGDGYQINLTKDTETGKWKVDTSDSTSNYDYKNLVEAFIGGV